MYPKLIGDEGTGKSVLVDCLMRVIDFEFIFTVLPHPDLSINDFFKFLARELGMDSACSGKIDFLRTKRLEKIACRNGRRAYS